MSGRIAIALSTISGVAAISKIETRTPSCAATRRLVLDVTAIFAQMDRDAIGASQLAQRRRPYGDQDS